MALPNVHVELVHDPHRHRALVGWSADSNLIEATATRLLEEAESRARQFEGLDDIAAATERAEVSRLRRVLGLVLAAEGRGHH